MSILSAPANEAHIRRTLAAWLGARHPSQTVQIHAVDCPSATNGYSNETYRLDLSMSGRRQTRILRLPPAETSLYPDYNLARQYRFAECLQDTPGVPVPRCLGFEADPEPLGRPFFMMEYVEGRVPSDNPQFLESGWVLEASDAERERLWTTSLDALAALSHVRPQQQRRDVLDWTRGAGSRLEHLIGYYKGLIDWAAEASRPLEFPLLDELHGWLLRNAPPEAEPAIVWGDARPGNFIYRDFTPVALLDWELAYIGDPSADLAWMLIMQRFYERKLILSGQSGKRLGGFLSDGGSIEYYNARARQPIKHWRYFWLLSAYRHLSITQRFCSMLHESGVYDEATMMRLRRVPELAEDIESVLGDPNHDAFFEG